MIGSMTRNGLGVLALLSCCLCQHYGGQPQYTQPQQQYNPQYSHNTPPPPQILSHKQALNHDGNFKYLFTSDNGLAQGETISPDGSRSGGYAYTDPTGRKISVKYTAGKEGFRILEADHLPKAPQPVAPVPAAQSYPSQQYNGVQDDGQYRPELYEKPNYAYSAPAPYQQRAYSAPVPQSIQQNSINERDYHDEPGKAHSFGNGYVFEFSG
ncbi:endocuticle structural glycoprotein SgAbd-8-like [Coccinella septempunctata]|uniref:endocuticle structural glycoprotein SgAbd-8-like n=1 Tax=Coccinella septempunctata TaxID=41139 RepID=UPI001D082D4A|nr:endocuticle structural glycoprotein SgAbd-8-like [Coccinella septempunctata]